jgi:O-antigen/teichoic acid export membrane protein
MALRADPPTAEPSPAAPLRCVASTRQYATTYASSLALVVATLGLLRLASDAFGDRGFAEFILSRRYLAALTPLLSLGLTVALAKQVPLRVATRGPEATHALLAASMQLVTLCCAAAYVATALAPESLSLLVTGERGAGPLLASLTVASVGLLWTSCTIAYCRGMLWNHSANAIQFVGIALLPLGLVLVAEDPERLFWANGLVLVLGNAVALPVALGFPLRRLLSIDRGALRTLLVQGAPRLPGDAAFWGLLSLPAIVATHDGGIEHGAEFAYALAVLTLMTQIVAPQNQLLLPEATYLLHSGDLARLRRRVATMAAFSLASTSAVVLLVVVLAEPFVRLHLGPTPASFVEAVRLVTPAAVALNLFLCLRGVVDATSRRALAPNLCVAAFAVFLGVQVLLAPTGIGSFALVVSLWVSTGMLAIASTAVVAVALRPTTRPSLIADESDDPVEAPVEARPSVARAA